ncbi:MAG: hypothetical protein J6X54_07035 [Treponema sp.]|nr:hypothetical protein [Treponema sp.]
MFDISQEEDYRELTLEEQFLVNGGEEVANTNEAVANSKPGDTVTRDDKTTHVITQGDINWAKEHCGANTGGAGNGNTGQPSYGSGGPSGNPGGSDNRGYPDSTDGMNNKTKRPFGSECYDEENPDPDKRYNGKDVNGKHLMLVHYNDVYHFRELRDYYLTIGKYGAAGTVSYDGIGLVNDEGQIIHVLKEEKPILQYSKSLGIPTGELHGDVFATVEGDLVYGLGFEGSVSLVIDLDNLKESGINVSYGWASGENVGISGGIGYVQRELEGITPAAIDVNTNLGGLQLISDNQGINGGTLSFGIGTGVSVSCQNSYTFTFSDIKKFFSSKH